MSKTKQRIQSSSPGQVVVQPSPRKQGAIVGNCDLGM